jgi:Rrf2 family transcriptional regulator, iron-sulfur cluster assembly transcription factor
MFSKACEYGIKSLLYIATQSIEGKRVKIDEIAQHTDSPLAFTAKVMSQLAKHELLSSQTGRYGGFFMEIEAMKAIRLSQVVEAIEGETFYNGCILGLRDCSHKTPCPLHEQALRVRAETKKMLESTSLYDLAKSLKEGKSTLKIK